MRSLLTRSWVSASLSGLFLLSGAACDDARSAGGVERTDSAGITITVSHGAVWDADGDATAWTIDPEPILELGGPDGRPETQFYQISGVVGFPDGRVVVGDRGSNLLRFFDSDGSFLHATGGEGGGPGEFWGLYRLWPLGRDSILVYDELEVRVSVFDAEGAFVRSWNPSLPGQDVWLHILTLTDDGSLIFGSRTEGYVRRGGASSDSLVLHRFSRDGQYAGTLGQYFWKESYRPERGESQGNVAMNWISGLPFGRRNRFGPAPAGFITTHPQEYEIQFRTRDGELRQLVRRPIENRPVRAEDEEALRYDWLGSDTDEWARSAYTDWVRTMEFPETMPPFGRVRVDTEGYLWVSDYSPAGNPVYRSAVFTPDGLFLGHVDIPPKVVIFQIGRDFVAGAWRDELGVEHVRVHRLNRG